MKVPAAEAPAQSHQLGQLGVIESVCAGCGVPLVRVGKEVTWTLLERSLDGQTIQSRGSHGVRVSHIPLAAPYEAENAVAAIAALEALQSRGVALDAECVSLGLSRTQWPGRFQVLARDPLLVLDGAHNPASMRRLAEGVDLFRRSADIVYVLGFSSDKDVRGAVAELSHTGGRFVLTRSGQPRALEPREVAVRLGGFGVQTVCESDSYAALWRARSMVGAEGTVVVAGSLYLVGEVLRRWQNDTESHVRWGRPPDTITRVSGG
jgi:dihydrofolate synthase/folylpolyglutamate synthase